MNKEEILQISNLRAASGSTSLITMLIPSGYQIALISDRINTELSTASKIQNKIVRKDVISALKGLINSLKGCGHVAPLNGLVLLSGIVGHRV